MTKRKEDSEPIPKREAKKKTGANFANLRTLPHPAAELFNLVAPPAAVSDEQTADVQPAPFAAIKLQPLADVQMGQPADVQSERSAAVTASDAGVNTATPSMIADVNTAARPPLVQPQALPAAVQSRERRPASHVRVNFWLDAAKLRRYKAFAAEHGLTLTDFFDFAAVQMIERADVQQAEAGAVLTALDDLTIFKTRDDIISVYRSITGNRWKPSDDQLAARFNEADSRLVEIGLLNTALRFTGKRINSFKYFLPEIEEAIDGARETKLSDETIDIMLKRRRQQWEQKKAQQPPS